MATELTMALARALGLPKYTQRAVLTLDASEPPRLELTVLPVDEQGQFMLRLEPFADNTSSRGDADGPA
jgi:hypothetical protein